MGGRLIPSAGRGGEVDTNTEEVSATGSGAEEVFSCYVAEESAKHRTDAPEGI